MDDLQGPEYRTVRQMNACAVVALPVLRKLAAEGSFEARAALDKIDHILSEDWDG